MSNAEHTFGFDDTDGKAAESGEVFRAVASAYPATVFIVIPVDDVVTAVFDAPVTTVCGQNTLRISLFRSPTGNAVCGFAMQFSSFFVYRLPLNNESLADMWKIQIDI